MEKTYDPENFDDRMELANVLRDMFQVSKFKLENPGGQWEEIYSFQMPVPNMRILVYSTIQGSATRASGKDAIRVVAVYKAKDGQERGIVKETRINRTGTVKGISDRTLERMRSVYLNALHPEKCHCGAPKFISKNGNAVCAELCWVKK